MNNNTIFNYTLKSNKFKKRNITDIQNAINKNKTYKIHKYLGYNYNYHLFIVTSKNELSYKTLNKISKKRNH